VSILTPGGGVHADAAFNNCAVENLPTESKARQNNVVLRRLKRVAAVLPQESIPHTALHQLAIATAGRAGNIHADHRWIEGSHIAFYFAPSSFSLIAQTHIDGQIATRLPIILNKNLRRLPPSAKFGGLRCAP